MVGERQHLGRHTKRIETLLTFGFLMFVLSEACLFLSIFWSYLHNALAPTLELGAIWPPLGVSVLDPYGAPYLNTVVLLRSGITITLAHAKHRAVAREGGAFWVYLTVVLGALFTLVQAREYFSAEYSISDRIFGSLFFFGTGFHGAHVLVGSGFLLYVAVRFSQKHSSPGKSFIRLDFAAWY